MQVQKDFHLAGKKLMIGLPAYDHKVGVKMAVSLKQGLDIWLDPTIKLGHMGIHEYKSDFGNEVLYPSMQAAQRTLSTAA